MRLRHTLKAARSLVCIMAAAGCLPTTESNADERHNFKKPAADSMRGKVPGEMRDDNGVKMKVVWCPPGDFKMGSPESDKGPFNRQDQVDVALTEGFWLGKYEVTQSEWKQVMPTEPWKGQRFTKEGADYPATFVSWDDSMQFCRKLTERERQGGRLSDDWEFTLPTEARWERACRAGTETKFSFGYDDAKLGDYAWYVDNAQKAGESYAHPVGQKKANPWGLCDMHGNVNEWCREVYTEALPSGRDPDVQPDEKTGG
ncbi:MAG TPA: formylglycine-generating enzyme family protein [Planctomycetaceae bacterium]